MPVLEKIMVIRFGALGDVVRTIPAVSALRNKFPNAYIAWVIDDTSSGILLKNPSIDELMVFPRGAWVSSLRRLRKFCSVLKEMTNFIKKIRSIKADVVFDFHGLVKSGFISWLSGAKVRVGFVRNHSREFNFLFNNIRINPHTHRLNRIDKNFKLVEYFGAKKISDPPEFIFTEDEKKKIDTFLKNRSSAKIATIHPGTSYRGRYKQWQPEKFAQLADMLAQKMGLAVIFVWGSAEEQLVEKIQNQMTEKAERAPRLTLKELAYLIKRSDLFISADTGVMHIASMVGTPLVAIFGPSDPIQNAPAPYIPFEIVWEKVDCSPCRKRNCDDRKCIDAIQPLDVFNAVQALIDKGKIPTN